MNQISSSTVFAKANDAGLSVKEVTMGLTVVGMCIGGHIVRHGGTGWYDEAKVDRAIRASRLSVAA